MNFMILCLIAMLLVNEMAILVSGFYIMKAILTIKEAILTTQETTQKTTQEKRTHTKIQPTNYEGSFNNRNPYDKYKNKEGLYEPQKPQKGIEIKPKEAN